MNATEEKPQQINSLQDRASTVHDQSGVNMARTDSKIDTPLTQRRSRIVRTPTYELIGPDGKRRGIFNTVREAGEAAKRIWPGLEEGAPDGWNVQALGS